MRNQEYDMPGHNDRDRDYRGGRGGRESQYGGSQDQSRGDDRRYVNNDERYGGDQSGPGNDWRRGEGYGGRGSSISDDSDDFREIGGEGRYYGGPQRHDDR